MPGRLWRVIEPASSADLWSPARRRARAADDRHDGRRGIMIVARAFPSRSRATAADRVARRAPRPGRRAGDLLTTARANCCRRLSIGRVARVEPDKKSPHYVIAMVEPLATWADSARCSSRPLRAGKVNALFYYLILVLLAVLLQSTLVQALWFRTATAGRAELLAAVAVFVALARTGLDAAVPAGCGMAWT